MASFTVRSATAGALPVYGFAPACENAVRSATMNHGARGSTRAPLNSRKAHPSVFRSLLPTFLVFQQVGCHGAPAADVAERGHSPANRPEASSETSTSPSAVPEASTTDALSAASPSSDKLTADAEVAPPAPSEAGLAPTDPLPPDRPGVAPRACCDALGMAVCAAPDLRCWQLGQAAAACYELFRRGDPKASTLTILRKALTLTPLPAACR